MPGIYRKLRKLWRDPIAYCLDSKHAFLRQRGDKLFEAQTARYRETGRKNADKKITVVMTAYNTGHLVVDAVKSVLAQTHENLELMVIDDASTDDTLERLKELAETDRRLRVFHSPNNHGTYWSKNWCLSQADSDYVAFHDSDDLSDPTRLQTQLGAILDKGGAAAVTCRWRRVDAEGNPLVIDGLPSRMAAISLMIDRTKVLRETGYFDSVRISADTEFITRITQVFGKKSIRHMRQILYTGLLRDGSLTTGQNSGFSWKSEGRNYVRALSGDRAEYHQAFHEWHDTNIGNEKVLFVEFPQAERKFPAPEGIRLNCDDLNTNAVQEVSEASQMVQEAS